LKFVLVCLESQYLSVLSWKTVILCSVLKFVLGCLENQYLSVFYDYVYISHYMYILLNIVVNTTVLTTCILI
jgi:hypothetical protein